MTRFPNLALINLDDGWLDQVRFGLQEKVIIGRGLTLYNTALNTARYLDMQQNAALDKVVWFV